MKTKSTIFALILFIIFLSGCDSKDGSILTEIDVPLGYELNLFSENEGIHPDTSVLDNPENPYSDANISMENVWDFSTECPSAKSRFYLWATILAKIPIGEYQYFTAKSLHELYTEGSGISENAREQAKKAYRATLDHFFESVTWWNAWWVDENTYYAVILRNLVAESLYDPTDMNLLPLYNDPAEALADMSEWGYVYDFETGIVSKRI